MPAAHAAAEALDLMLQGHPLLQAVSPVDVPTFRIPVDPEEPQPIPWADAARHAVVVFVDATMFRDRATFGPWLDGLVQQADGHRALVLAVTDNPGTVANLSPALAGKQLIRVPRGLSARDPDPAAWSIEVRLRVFRALATILAEPAEGLGRLFLSHAKVDGLWLAAALRDEISRFADGLAFFDAVSLREGEQFEASLLTGFTGAVVVGLMSDAWSGRYWCAWEVVKGKEQRCPFLLVDLLTDGEPRSVRYAGNARTLRWPLEVPTPGDRLTWAPAAADASATAVAKRNAMANVIAAALLELVRVRHDRAQVEAARAAGAIPADVEILGAAPELATLPSFAPPKPWRLVHPDPALPLAERELLARMRPDVTVASLTEALAGAFSPDPGSGTAHARALRIAVSISDPPSEDLRKFGLTRQHTERLWSRLALQLLLAGHHLGYGGDLRQQGYTERLGDLLVALAGTQRAPASHVHAYLGWPVWVGIDVSTWSRYPRHVVWHRLAQPNGLTVPVEPAPTSDWSDFEAQLAWTVSMRAMRERMADDHDARVLVGGQHRAVSPIPGLADELTTFLDRKKPIYLLGGFGGMAGVLSRALCGQTPLELTEEYQDDGGKRTAVRIAIQQAIQVRTVHDAGELDGDSSPGRSRATRGRVLSQPVLRCNA
ncbi:MAG: hypothetical protein ABL982_21100, partial [Vicinamibacterales bacterium]